MTANQVYEQNIKPLSAKDKLAVARLIIDDVARQSTSNKSDSDYGFDYLKRMLPQIERITFTDEDIDGIVLEHPKSNS